MSTELEDAFAWTFGGVIMDDAHEQEIKMASTIAIEMYGEDIIESDEWFGLTTEIQMAMYGRYVIIVEEYDESDRFC